MLRVVSILLATRNLELAQFQQSKIYDLRWILDYKPELHRLSPTVYEVLVWSFNSRNKIQVQLYLNDTKMNNLINQKKLSIYDVKGF